ADGGQPFAVGAPGGEVIAPYAAMLDVREPLEIRDVPILSDVPVDGGYPLAAFGVPDTGQYPPPEGVVVGPAFPARVTRAARLPRRAPPNLCRIALGRIARGRWPLPFPRILEPRSNGPHLPAIGAKASREGEEGALPNHGPLLAAGDVPNTNRRVSGG